MKTLCGMLLVAGAIVLFSLLPAGGGVGVGQSGEWQAIGDGNYLWRQPDGKSDGWVYAWHLGGYGYHNQYQSRAVRALSAEELQQVNGPVEQAQSQQQAAQYQQQQVQNVYGSGQGAPEVGWRARGLAMLSQAQEQQHFNEFLDRVLPGQNQQAGQPGMQQGSQPSYGQQGYGQQGGQSISASQYGGANGLQVLLGQLPVQQGNSVYGSLDPTFNSFADPLRTFDYGAMAQQLIQMQSQYQAGGLQLGQDLQTTIRAMAENARVLKEVEMHWQGRMSLLRSLKDIDPRPSTSQAVLIQTDSTGRSTVTPIPGGGPGMPPGGPGVPPGASGHDMPPGGPPGNGAASEPPGASGGQANDEQLFMGIVQASCLKCHGNDKPAGNLRLGKGSLVDFSGLNERQAKEIFKRVADGTMPQGQPLSSEEKAVFQRMEQRFAPPGQ